MSRAEQDLVVREGVPIAELTTMRLGGAARYVIELNRKSDVKKALAFAETRGLPVWMMGGGANTIGRDEGFDGVILLNRLRGVFIKKDGALVEINELDRNQLDEEITLVGMGGEIWDDFVAIACDLGYSGVEAMSMIPGTLGAAPVQNIGAYGQDIAQVIESVEAYDLRKKRFVQLKRDEMGLGYRSTRFNSGADAGRFLILSVAINLKKGELSPPFYNSLTRYIQEHNETDFSPKNIRRMVMELRSQKLPDPDQEASAGSFFKNVLLSKEEADRAEEKDIPVWRNADGSGKINTGWLIEQTGLKGQELNGFEISDKAALILINRSAKSYSDLAWARQKIVDAVREKFGFEISQEPVELVVAKGE